MATSSSPSGSRPASSTRSSRPPSPRSNRSRPALRGLLTINEAGEWTADLATEVPSADNGGLVPRTQTLPADCTTSDAPTGDCFTLNVTLKPGYKWSDGKAVTLNDFVTTYEQGRRVGRRGRRLLRLRDVRPAARLDPRDDGALCDVTNRYIKDLAVAADGMSMTVTWQKNYAGWLGWLSTCLPASRMGDPASTARPRPAPCPSARASRLVPWNGPFKIVAASVDGIDYERNDNWGGDTAQPQDPPRSVLRQQGRHDHRLPVGQRRPRLRHDPGRLRRGQRRRPRTSARPSSTPPGSTSTST